jgi:glycosyltransferase involved in cell wall biosynthesis
MTARVSAIIPAYNTAPTIAEALDSVLAQTFAPIEIVVVDDGSTDDLDAVLAPYANDIKLVRQRNRGLAGARNAGVAASSGEYLALLDADDIWLPERVATAVAMLDAEPRCPATFSAAVLMNPDGTDAGVSIVPRARDFRPTMTEILTGSPPLRPSTCTVRRAAFDKVGGYDPRFTGSGGEDIYFNLLLSEIGPLGFIAQPLIRYRLNPRHSRLEKYEQGRHAILRLVRARYGAAAREPLRAAAHLWSRSWRTAGFQALAAGDRARARAAFRAALRYEPADVRGWMRLMRTWLPLAIARGLSGRMGGARARGSAATKR